jgi:pectinesterase
MFPSTKKFAGTVDFVFGDAAAWFGVCTIGAKQSGGAITANSRTLSTDTSWYVFDTCTVGAASGYSLSNSVYLGRPWRVLARVIFQNSVLSAAIAAAGWSTLAADATP